METKGKLAAEEIGRLKSRHGRVWEVEVEDDGARYCAYFRRPDMATLSAMAKLARADEMRTSAVLMENCFVGGAEEVKTDTALFLAAAGQLGKIVAGARATLKNA